MNIMQLAAAAMNRDQPQMKALVGDVATIGRLHLDLFVMEARAEHERLKRKLLLLVGAYITGTLGVLFFLIAVVAAAWDGPYRNYVLFGVPILLTLLALIFYNLAAPKPGQAAPFALSANELKKDCAWVMERL